MWMTWTIASKCTCVFPALTTPLPRGEEGLQTIREVHDRCKTARLPIPTWKTREKSSPGWSGSWTSSNTASECSPRFCSTPRERRLTGVGEVLRRRCLDRATPLCRLRSRRRTPTLRLDIWNSVRRKGLSQLKPKGNSVALMENSFDVMDGPSTYRARCRSVLSREEEVDGKAGRAGDAESGSSRSLLRGG